MRIAACLSIPVLLQDTKLQTRCSVEIALDYGLQFAAMFYQSADNAPYVVRRIMEAAFPSAVTEEWFLFKIRVEIGRATGPKVERRCGRLFREHSFLNC